MLCAHCEHENRTGARFCNSCGAQMDADCPSCGQVNPPGSRFCDSCGQGLDSPPVLDQRQDQETPAEPASSKS
ncbi:MAG: zinc ribbon domain-containing protein, partial [Chloroflexi bacterium]|nr:zinc ribbon domain-containing protein [Chloroflexota bacterium]